MSLKETPWRARDYFRISVFSYALTGMWFSVNVFVLPVLVLGLVPEAQKNTYLGVLSFSGLALATLSQPLWGAFSDVSSSRWGRRRPFILLGSFLAIFFLLGMGLAQTIFLLALFFGLLQLSTNIAQAPYQAFIPDLVPAERRGTASAAKNIADVFGVLTMLGLVSYLMSRLQSSHQEMWLWAALGLCSLALGGAGLYTWWRVREPASPLPKAGAVSLKAVLRIDLAKNADLRRFILSRFFIVLGAGPAQAYAFFFLQDVMGIEDPGALTSKLIFTAGPFLLLALLLAMFLAGPISDRLGRRPPLLISGLLLALGFAILLVLRNFWGLMGLGIFGGVAAGVFVSVTWAMATDLVPRGEEAKYLALTNIATAGGSAVSRLGGPIIDFVNARWASPMGYWVVILLSVVFLSVGGLLLNKVRETGRVLRQSQTT